MLKAKLTMNKIKLSHLGIFFSVFMVALSASEPKAEWHPWLKKIGKYFVVQKKSSGSEKTIFKATHPWQKSLKEEQVEYNIEKVKIQKGEASLSQEEFEAIRKFYSKGPSISSQKNKNDLEILVQNNLIFINSEKVELEQFDTTLDSMNIETSSLLSIKSRNGTINPLVSQVMSRLSSMGFNKFVLKSI